MKRTPMPARTSTLARAGRLPYRSDKMKVTQGELRKAYKVVAAEQHECFTCESPYDLQNSHLHTQKQHPEHRSSPLNIVRECPGCHMFWEHQKHEYARRWPEKYALKVQRMAEIDPAATRFFLRKNPEPATRPNPLLYPDE